MRHDFDELRVSLHHSFVKWSLGLLGILFSSYATLCLIVIEHLQK